MKEGCNRISFFVCEKSVEKQKAGSIYRGNVNFYSVCTNNGWNSCFYSIHSCWCCEALRQKQQDPLSESSCSDRWINFKILISCSDRNWRRVQSHRLTLKTRCSEKTLTAGSSLNHSKGIDCWTGKRIQIDRQQIVRSWVQSLQCRESQGWTDRAEQWKAFRYVQDNETRTHTTWDASVKKSRRNEERQVNRCQIQLREQERPWCIYERGATYHRQAFCNI